MLCNARVEWNEFDRAFPLDEEFVKTIRKQGSISIGLWIIRAFNSGVKEFKSFVNGIFHFFESVFRAFQIGIKTWFDRLFEQK